MTVQVTRPDVGRVLAGLKDFQRATVDYAFRRLYADPDSTRRFLVADEVGLGKTLVARGIIARVVEHLWEKVPRIDIVYVCSNADIARQNINRLRLGEDSHFALSSRVTLLPIEVHDLKRNKLNFISFTPGTSFDLKSSMGHGRERVLLYWLLKEEWNLRGAAPLNILQGSVGTERFRQSVKTFRDQHEVDPDLQAAFHEALERHARVERQQGRPDLRERFEDLMERFGRARKHRDRIPQADREARRAVVGELRTILAATCMEALEPDLIILDEFQRFKHLLEGDADDGASQLARELFEYADDVSSARVLLLSATPYKMYTLSHEAETDDHYQDFLRTLRFLDPDADAAARCKLLLQQYRTALYGLADGAVEPLREAKTALEVRLRRVMCRSERLAVTTDRDGMLVEQATTQLPLAANDLHHYRTLEQIGDCLDCGDIIELWKSAPYLLNFMEDYKLKRELRRAQVGDDAARVCELLADRPDLLLRWGDIRRYRAIDPANARLRWLRDDTLGRGAWRLLWLPPSLPYYELRGPFAEPRLRAFTKRLVFSAWVVVPRVIATLLSYDAERMMIGSLEEKPENTPEARERRARLLRFAEGRRTGMPVLGLMYPSVALAEVFDPLELTARGERGASVSIEEALSAVKHRITTMLRGLERYGGPTGLEDEAWYWAAPILLDLLEAPSSTREWWNQKHLDSVWAGGEEDERERQGWLEHVNEARQVASGLTKLGRMPQDLPDVLAQLALGGPGVVTLRALGRVLDTDLGHTLAVRNDAASIGWAFRTLFNLPEATALIRGMASREPYWRRVLEYCVHGNLQAVLDEYVHVLQDSLGLSGRGDDEASAQLADEIWLALTLRTVSLRVDRIALRSQPQAMRISKEGLRTRFALRFGDEPAGGDEREGARPEQVRIAFNSPFWPFVLATTSVGQEGLDFHQYCHAVVHWNLPSNPVDLEQREGRVHRYKGHAVRKNLARAYRWALGDGGGDPWELLFRAAVAGRPSDTSDLVPFWVFSVDGGVKIERYVPALPLSRDLARLEGLRRSLAVYRMVFGQPRQEDLVAYLMEHVKREEAERYSKECSIDLSPMEVRQ